MKVLIADDAQMLRQRMVKLLADTPGIADILEADCCESTRERLRDDAPSVLVLDLFMPDGSGLEVLRELADGNHKPSVIVLTTWADEDVRQQCLSAGAEYFFDKANGFFDAVDTVKRLAASN